MGRTVVSEYLRGSRRSVGRCGGDAFDEAIEIPAFEEDFRVVIRHGRFFVFIQRDTAGEDADGQLPVRRRRAKPPQEIQSRFGGLES